MLRAFSKHQQNMDDAKIVPGSAIPVALDDVIRSMTCLWSKAWKRNLYYYCTCSSGLELCMTLLSSAPLDEASFQNYCSILCGFLIFN